MLVVQSAGDDDCKDNKAMLICKIREESIVVGDAIMS